MNDLPENATYVFATSFGALPCSLAELEGLAAVARTFPDAKVTRIAWHYRKLAAERRLKMMMGGGDPAPEAEGEESVVHAPALVAEPATIPTEETFCALDFETADERRDSACQLGIARVVGNEIIRERMWLIRPPRKEFSAAAMVVHGLTWENVKESPTFRQLWPEIAEFLAGAHYIVAHNVGFDRSVMRSCLEAMGQSLPALPWVCTVKLSKAQWPGLPDHKLDTVARHLGLDLTHHDAASDARVSAMALMNVRNLRGAQWSAAALYEKPPK